MKNIKQFEAFVYEAKRSEIHKASKEGDYPVTIVAIEDGKVVHQEIVDTPQAVPASFNVLQKKYPKAKLHVEDKGGKILFQESLEIDEARSWGTFGTPEAKKVIKKMDKAWDRFSKSVSKAHADFRKEVKSIVNSEDGSKSGIVDSEGGAYITGMVNNFARKEFMMDDLGDISRYKYMNDLYESTEVNEAKVTKKDFDAVVKVLKKSKYPITVMYVKKWDEIDIIVGYNAPDKIAEDVMDKLEDAGLYSNSVSVSGDSSNYSRREYDAIEKINGGHRRY